MSDTENGTEEVKAEVPNSPARSPTRILNGPPSDTLSTEDSLEQKISLRMEIMLKKERLKQEEEANYTYKPTLYTSNTKPSKKTIHSPQAAVAANNDENRFDKLYSDALKRHISQNLKEDQKDKDLTFTPTITKRASSATRSNSASRGGSRSGSRERGGVNSHGNDSVSDGRRTPTSRKSVEPEKPTFQPAISKRAKSIERTRDKEVAERLYEHGLHVKEKMERKRSEAEQKELETCTFAPKLVDGKRSSSASRLNVVERLSRFEEVRQKKLQDAIEQKKETEKSFSFQPTLLAKRPTTPTQQQQPFYERLAVVSNEKRVSAAAMEAMSQLTFHPQVVSKRAPSPNTTRSSIGDYKSIHERLYREGEEHRREQENELQTKRHELDADLTFHPQIIVSPTSNQTYEPVFERLSTGTDRLEVKQKLDRIKSELTKEWTFQPHISAASKKLTGQRREQDTSMYERQVASQRRIDEELQKKKEALEQKELEEATFAPRLPESSKELAKKKISMNNMDPSANQDVYSRLLAHAQSPTGTVQETSFVSNGSNNPTIQPVRSSIILPEKVLSQVFERLATPSVQQLEEYAREPEQKKVLLPAKEKDQVFNRLNVTKTMSFTFKEQERELRHPSPTFKHHPPLTEEALLERDNAAGTKKEPPQASAVSSLSGVGKDSPTKSKATRPVSASKNKTPNSKTNTKPTNATPTAVASAKKSAVKGPPVVLPSPPVVRRDKLVSPMPPAPPATAVKGNNSSTSQPDYYDDLAKKLEASLSLINQTNAAVAPPPAPAPAVSPVKNGTKAPKTDVKSAKKYEITDSPLPKDSEDFINSIPVVADNGELSD